MSAVAKPEATSRYPAANSQPTIFVHSIDIAPPLANAAFSVQFTQRLKPSGSPLIDR